jgi:hypothetical protein
LSARYCVLGLGAACAGAGLAPSFISEAIRAGAPKFDIALDKKVTPLR